jgi:RNA-binding protein
MSEPLTNRDRARLKARAHALEPVVHVGGTGVTDSLIREVDRALTAHELIKIKIPADDRAARIAIGDEVCARTGAAAVHRVGKVLILWRRRANEDASPDNS